MTTNVTSSQSDEPTIFERELISVSYISRTEPVNGAYFMLLSQKWSVPYVKRRKVEEPERSSIVRKKLVYEHTL